MNDELDRERELSSIRYRTLIAVFIQELQRNRQFPLQIADDTLMNMLYVAQTVLQFANLKHQALRLFEALFPPLYLRGYWSTIQDIWSGRLLSLIHDEQVTPALRARLLVQLGIIHKERGCFSKAQQVYQQALMICQQHNGIEDVERQRADTLFQYGVCLLRQRQFTAAISALKSCIRACSSDEQLEVKSFAYGQIARIAEARNHFALAHALYEKSRSVLLELGEGNPLERIVIYSQGTVYLSEGYYEHAERLLRQALAINESLGDAISTARCLERLGHCILQLGRVDEAVIHLIRAIDFAGSSKVLDIGCLIKARLSLAEAYIAQGKISMARDELQIAYHESAESELEELREKIQQHMHRLNNA